MGESQGQVDKTTTTRSLFECKLTSVADTLASMLELENRSKHQKHAQRNNRRRSMAWRRCYTDDKDFQHEAVADAASQNDRVGHGAASACCTSRTTSWSEGGRAEVGLMSLSQVERRRSMQRLRGTKSDMTSRSLHTPPRETSDDTSPKATTRLNAAGAPARMQRAYRSIDQGASLAAPSATMS